MYLTISNYLIMSATTHLYNNFLQLQKEPIIGANACFDENNIMKWYCNVVGSQGSLYENVLVRFILEFTNDYPNSPPKAFFETYFAYSGGAQMRDDKGRIGVCLDIFGNFGMVHTEWKNNVGSGWSPSYTVSTILVTMQCLLSDSSLISTRPTDIQQTRSSSINYKCPFTGHDGSDRSKWVPCVYLTIEEVDEYKKSNGITNNVHSYNPLTDEYICYITKKNKQSCAMLGFGINIENQRVGILSSPCEYLSKEAFDSGTRQSTFKKPFTYWLPILIESNDWQTIKPLFVQTVNFIAKELSYTTKTCINVVKVCSSLMNSLVVEIMNTKNNVTANDKFINGYFAIYRLLKQYSSDDIESIEFINNQLANFRTSVSNRNKSIVPNLGELLIYLTISDQYTWNTISQFFLEESDARNVFWYAVGNYNNRASYPELIDPNYMGGRVTKVFSATETSRKLIMYQVEFSKVAKSITFESMDSNYGLAPVELRNRLKNMYSEIDNVVDWNGYFRWLNLPELSANDRTIQLSNAVILSNTQKYTGSSQKQPTKNPFKKFQSK